MLLEKDTALHERYLLAICSFSDNAIENCKKISQRQLKDELKRVEFERFLMWKNNKNELAVFTSYAYADFSIPKTFNCVFDIHNPTNFTIASLTIKQSIWEGWYPINYVDHGHKHLLIVEYENEIPELMLRLKKINTGVINLPKIHFQLGICQLEDFPIIKEKIESNQ